MTETQIYRDRKHDHYWVEDGILFESYKRIRGLRYRGLEELSPDFEDCHRCDEAYMKRVEEFTGKTVMPPWE